MSARNPHPVYGTDSDQIKYVQQSLIDVGHLTGVPDGLFWADSRKALKGALGSGVPAIVPHPIVAPPGVIELITPGALQTLSTKFSLPVPVILAVKEVESGGAWFDDVRKDILDLDGPGGFIDGRLLKILFEAHHFGRLTHHIYDLSYPNISAPHWNRALYVGGQAEYSRLYKAMKLNEDAALQSASWGLFQIMGFNYTLAGYANASAMVEAFKYSEVAQLKSFLLFCETKVIHGKNLLAWLRTGRYDYFAEGYNGEGYALNHYDTKIAKAVAKYS